LRRRTSGARDLFERAAGDWRDAASKLVSDAEAGWL
jgi:hypothetical protein